MIEVPRSRESFRKGTYRIVTTEAGNRHVLLCCPGCGAGGFLDHEIAADGTVTPSVVCPSGACDWHQMVRLKEWEPPIPQEMKR